MHSIEGRVAALRDVAPLVASLPIDDIRRQGPRLAQRLDLAAGVVQLEIAARIGLEPTADCSRILPEIGPRRSAQDPPRAPWLGYPLLVR